MSDVAANHENDTCFGNGLVMGSADCIVYAGLVKTLERLFKRKLGHLPDKLQAGPCIFPPFQISHDHFAHVSYPQFLPKGQYGLYFGYLVSGLLPLRSHKDRSPFWESQVFRLHSKLARSILALKLSVTTTLF